MSHRVSQVFLTLCFASFAALVAVAQEPKQTYTPYEGQEGKDVVWVPTPYSLVEKMLDMAKVTPQDFVMDLGSGDGRNIIAAAKRGARTLGIEYNPDMVRLSRELAAKAGVADKAIFVEGDMYEADISKATVLALFLLPENLDRLVDKFLALPAGTRIVLNTYPVSGWTPDETDRATRDCGHWCTALLYYVPARVAGTWRVGESELVLTQEFQMISGTITTKGVRMPITNGRLRGDRISFTVGTARYEGQVVGNTVRGEIKSSTTTAWEAVRK
jgi:SAM-dependent methyltransferase